MVGINNNNYTSQVPPTFGNGSNNYQTTTYQQTQAPNPFQGGDKYSVDNTSQAFDQAMAKLTGQNVFTNQTTNNQNTQMTTQSTNSPQLPAGVTQSDLNWAMALEQKFQQGYTPTQQETQVYQSIAAKLSAAATNPTANMQTQQNTQVNTPNPQSMGITQEELNWVIAVENAVKGGYTPNAQEAQAYQNIANKMAAAKNQPTQMTTQNTQQTNQLPAGVSQQEIDWALAFESKLKQGYKPTSQETFDYNNILNKVNASKQAQQNTQQTNQLPAGVTQQDLQWALDLENKVKGGYKPTPEETQAYQALSQKLTAAQTQAPQMSTQQTSQLPAGVTQQDLQWALDLENKVKGGYTPTAQETQAYQALAQKLSSAPTQTTQNTQQTNQLPAGVTQQEIDWALQLENKVKGGYKPTNEETQAYQALAQKISSANNKQTGNQTPQITQQEVDWALQLENKVKGGYNPTPEETATYQNIAHKLQVQQQSGNNQQGGKDWQAWSQPFTVPRSLFQTTPNIIQVPATLRSSSPSLPTYTVANTGPNLVNVPKTLPMNNNKPTSNTSNTQAPSKSEIDWALALEDKVKKNGYTPNESELYQYKNIADRLASSQGKTNPVQNQGNANQTQQNMPNGQKTSIGQRLSNAWNALTK